MRRTSVIVVIGVLALAALAVPWPRTPAPRAQGVDVYINVTGGGAKKLNIAVPEFTVIAGTDTAGLGKLLASVAGNDLTFSGLFSVVAGTGAIPPNSPDARGQLWSEFAAAGAHAALHGLLALRGDRLETEMRLYDLTTPEHRLIAAKKFEGATAQPRRLAHKIADQVVLQFTGELGIADTKIAYVQGPAGAKEVWMSDYDGVNPAPATRNGSINLMPVWSPDGRSLAITSFMQGYPDLYRIFPFERRPVQTLASFVGINSSPAWSPDGRYLAPTGQQIAFVADRNGQPHIHVMDPDGANIREITSGGFHTQPRWSPKGDTIVYTQRQGTHDLWAVSPDGSNPRRLTAGPGDNQGAGWAPNARHLAFQSNRLGRWQLFAMLFDGSPPTQISQGTEDRTSPSWSPRLP